MENLSSWVSRPESPTLAVRHPTQVIHVLLDNYNIHSSQRVTRYLQAARRFVLHFLPPYSLDENRFERLWREVHATFDAQPPLPHDGRTAPGAWWYLRREIRRRSRPSEPREAIPLFETVPA